MFDYQTLTRDGYNARDIQRAARIVRSDTSAAQALRELVQDHTPEQLDDALAAIGLADDVANLLSVIGYPALIHSCPVGLSLALAACPTEWEEALTALTGHALSASRFSPLQLARTLLATHDGEYATRYPVQVAA